MTQWFLALRLVVSQLLNGSPMQRGALAFKRKNKEVKVLPPSTALYSQAIHRVCP